MSFEKLDNKRIEEILFFLEYNYFPDFDKPFVSPFWGNARSDDKHVFNSLLSIICSYLKDHNSDQIVVPLSGGLDSRILLACAMEIKPLDKIKTFTYGLSNSYDMKIAQKITKELDIAHKPVLMDNIKIDDIDFEDIVVATEGKTTLFHTPNINEIKEYISDDIILSGVMGDVVGGVHIKDTEKSDHSLHKAHLSFLNDKKSSDLKLYSPKQYLELFKDVNLNNEFELDAKDYLYFYHRYPKYYKPHIEYDDFNYCTPFLHRDFAINFLGKKVSFTERKKEYKKLINSALKSKLKDFPLKQNFGARLEDNLFYINFRKSINYFKRRYLNDKSHMNFYDPSNLVDLKFEKELLESIKFISNLNNQLGNKLFSKKDLIIQEKN